MEKKKEIDDDYNKWYAKKLEFSKNFCDRMTVRTKLISFVSFHTLHI